MLAIACIHDLTEIVYMRHNYLIIRKKLSFFLIESLTTDYETVSTAYLLLKKHFSINR